MSEQTTVEWLEEKLKENLKHIVLNNDYVLMESIFLQAKSMEREQIIEAFDKAYPYDIIGYDAAEQYYNNTYKGGEQ